jgi:tRNA 2-selenouridine synthase
MSGRPRLSADEALSLIHACRRARARGETTPVGLLDVRSEGEAHEAGLPDFINVPILNNDERHRVGLTYKSEGQPAAVALGHELVDPQRPARVAAWAAAARASAEERAVVCCWRGGMRSGIAAQWLREAGVSAATVEGGYKAIRRRLIARLEAPPPLLALSGMTGTGKTDFLREFARTPSQLATLDLEALANHRGSAFGSHVAGGQPTQATFENGVALGLGDETTPLLVEDESKLIGRLRVPMSLERRMRASPVVVLEASTETRVARIRREYVEEPVARGHALEAVEAHLVRAAEAIRARLGHQRADALIAEIRRVFATGGGRAHDGWIARLLEEYYDPSYRFGFDRQARRVVFRGDAAACTEWLRGPAARIALRS